jgi:TRAP transporter TAXI family solute receptor
MRLWLFERFGRKSGSEHHGTESHGTEPAPAASGRSLGKTMSIESLEHMVRNRVRMFLRHTWLVTALGTIAVIGLIWGAFYASTKTTVMRVAAGPAGSANAQLIELLGQRFVREHDRIRLELVTTSGPKDSAQAMASGRADLAVVPSTIGGSPDWPVVAIVRQNVVALIVPPASARKGKAKGGKIEKVTQLSGRRVGIVTGNAATPDLLNVVLNHYGVPLAKVTISQIDPKNVRDAIKNNLVDVLFVAGSATGQAITDTVAAATQNGDAPTFVEIDQADGIAKRNPAFDSIDIDAGTFGGNPPSPDDSLKSLKFAEYLVARRSFSHDSVATLSKLIYTSRLALAAAMPGEVKIEAPSTDKDADVTVHAGAIAYLTDDQKTFFDKYGDDIFYGLLIFPIFGSAIAAVAGYLRNDSRTRRLRLLQRVLDLVRKAHAAQTLEAIEQLQIDADNLVISIIHHSEHEEFDETVRMSFAFALDQLRFAIAARRTAILDHIGGPSKAAAA